MSTPLSIILTEAEKDVVDINAEISGPVVTKERANRNVAVIRGSFFNWFDPNDGEIERKLVLKLDFFILTYACVGFWTLYIDRGMLQNAYVSGMREDLHLFGNQLVQLNTVFQVGYASSMIPATLLITKLPAHRVIPASMMLWATFTLLSYRAKSFSELAGYRFLVGVFEGPFFCSIHYVLGSWYRPDEIVRRSGIFYVSSSLGTMTTGLLAARIYANLNGALGHSGWRWMYIVAGILTFPVAIWGFFTFPGTPSTGKRWIFTQDEYDIAIERMVLCGRKEPQGFQFRIVSFQRFFARWHWYILVPWNIMWLMGYMSQGQGALTLWLKSNKQYTIIQVNNFTAISPSLGIIFILAFSWIADRYGDNARLSITGLVCIVGIVINLAFVLYKQSPVGWKWFTVTMGYLEVSLSPLIYSWVNLICAGDAEERAFVISSMLAIGTAFGAWVPLLMWKTVEAPRYFKGYTLQLVMQPVYFFWTFLVFYMVRRARRLAAVSKLVG